MYPAATMERTPFRSFADWYCFFRIAGRAEKERIKGECPSMLLQADHESGSGHNCE